MRGYRELFGIPGVPRLIGAVLLSRVATSMLNLALLVAVTRRYGYADAGLLLMVFTLANALVGPVRGRVADRRVPHVVMLWLVAGHAVAWGGLVAGLFAAVPVVALGAAAAVLGATVPPAGPVVRGLWPRLVPPARLPVAYAFDAALNTSTFVAGPMVAGAALAVVSPPWAVAGIGVVKLGGDLLVALAPVLRAPREPGTRTGGFLGPLALPGVRTLLVMIGLDAAAFGCVEVAAVAAAAGGGAAGVLTSASALGAVVSGLAYGARTWSWRPPTQLAVLHAVGAVLLGAAGWVNTASLAVAAVVYAGYGLLTGPVETLQQVLVGGLTPDDRRIEAFAWVISVMWAGFGIGATAAGGLVADGAPGGGLYAAAFTQAVVAVVALTGMRRPPHTRG